MSEEVDELFGQGEGAPAPRTSLALGLLVAGLVLAVAGMVCSAAPGGVLVLLAWLVIEKERDRVESGYLPPTAAPQVRAVRTLTYAGVVTVIGLFAVQGVLLCTSFYDTLWMRMISWWLGV
jgi:hypothetical protein